MALATLGTKDNTKIGHHVRGHELGWEAIVVTPQIQGVRVRLLDKTGVAKDAYSFFAYGNYDILTLGPISDERDAELKAPEYPGWTASGHLTETEWQAREDDRAVHLDKIRQEADILKAEQAAKRELVAHELAQADYRFTGQPEHYNGHPSGVECQEIIRECKDPLVAFAMKHLWRSQWGNKPGAPKVLDLQKTIEYCQLELAREAGEKRL